MRSKNGSGSAYTNENYTMEWRAAPNFDGVNYWGSWRQAEDYVGSSSSFTQFQPTSFLNAIIKL